MEKKKSIISLICESIVEGELPEGFSLPQEETDGLRYAAGAKDGIRMYHFAPPEYSDKEAGLIASAFEKVQDTQQAFETFERLFETLPPIFAIDYIQHFIIDNKDTLDFDAITKLMIKGLMSDKTDLVKLGLILSELLGPTNEKMADLIRVIGLSDEFTVFSVFNMLTWENGNAEIFELAKHVHGWGRIHAVERLEPETEKIKQWLLSEGAVNDIMPEYSALVVFDKAEISRLLAGNLTDEQLDCITLIINALMDEGPIKGISMVSDAKSVLAAYITQVNSHKLTLEGCEALLAIISDERFEELERFARPILLSDECRAMLDKEIKQGRGLRLADSLGIDTDEIVFSLIRDDFENSCFLARRLIPKEEYRQRVLDVFADKLPLDKMGSGPEDEMGLGKEFKDYTSLLYAVQELADYPLEGTELISTALMSPVINNRNMALRILDAWCRAKGCGLKELSEELYGVVMRLKEKEVSGSVKENIGKYGF